MAVCLYLAAAHSTNASVQRAVLVHSPYCFIGAFEFHHTPLLAKFFAFHTIAKPKQYAYGNLRIPKDGG
eukprot:1909894-Pleurochrysis_carterae.AAC.1